MGATDKSAALRELSRMSGVPVEQMAYIGDDVNDLPAIGMCGFSDCPADATPAVQAAVHIVLDAKGGEGAVRLFAEICLGNAG